jgi:prepilin-type N-terminal cleavage/methylation domain-containing protein
MNSQKFLSRRNRGMTLIEVITVTAISTLMFGLVLGAMISTNREANDAALHQGMRQEALLAAHRLEKVVRFRVPSGALSGAPPAATGLPAGDVRIAREPEKFAPDELTLVTVQPTEVDKDKTELRAIAASVKNVGGVAETASHAYLQMRELQGSTAVSRRDLASQSDRYQSSISFRYATFATTSSAAWTGSSNEVPRLIEYTIRIWPNRPQFRNYDDARDPVTGRLLGFEYISAVRVP